MLKTLPLYALQLFFPFCLVAQKATFEFFTRANGLAGNSTTSVTQDDQGFIWLLNDHKLLRFDGRKFLNYPISPDVIGNGLLFYGLTTYEDSLLLLTTRQSVLLLNPKNGKWESFPLSEIPVPKPFGGDGIIW